MVEALAEYVGQESCTVSLLVLLKVLPSGGSKVLRQMFIYITETDALSHLIPFLGIDLISIYNPDLYRCFYCLCLLRPP